MCFIDSIAIKVSNSVANITKQFKPLENVVVSIMTTLIDSRNLGKE